MTIAAIQFGFIPLIVDLSPSHVFHADWPEHARFHMVWTLVLSGGLAAFLLGLIWWPGANRILRLKLASLLGLIPFTAFFLAVLLMPRYGGALADPNHQILIMSLDGNLFAFLVATIIQLIALLLIWKSSEAQK